MTEIVEQTEPLPEVPEAFAITDGPTANWVVRKIVEARAYADHVKAWAAAEVRRAEREEQFFLQRFGHQLETWVRAQLRDGRRKSLKLPAGTVGFRIEPPRLDVIDDQVLIRWCRKALPSALRVETHVLRSIVKDHVQQTGECPEGAQVAGGQKRFYVR